jgi:maleylpyruvate isomerase
MAMDLALHGYWRSTASYRVRIALNLKGLDYRQITHDLRSGEQSSADYAAINPQGLVPALETHGTTLTQSPAILEWLEERFPTPPLLPATPGDRVIIRAMVALVCCDMHPLNNLRVLNALRKDFGASEAKLSRWIAHWIETGFAALEQLVARHGSGFAFGDAPTLADCCIVPQAYSAQRFGISLKPYPAIASSVESCQKLHEFEDADPVNQPDAITII